jgi:hypothetical protein
MMWVNNQEKQVRPTWWQPWANTVAYFPFKNDTLDTQWNLTLTYNQIQQDTVGYKVTGWVRTSYTWHTVNYVGGWYNIQQLQTTWSWKCVALNCVDNPAMWNYPVHTNNTPLNQKFYVFKNSSFSLATVSAPISNEVWHHVAISYVQSENKTYGYLDWTQYLIYSGKWYNFWDNSIIFGSWNNNNTDTISWDWICLVSDVIFESQWWTAQDVSDYYNLTKSNYWL